MTAVGWTVRNRMARNKTAVVRDAWRGYQHGKPATDVARQIARDILGGAIADPTQGATHFYSPGILPKKGQETKGLDVGGGLEFGQG